MNVNDSVKTASDLTNKGMERVASFAELNMRAWEKMAARQMEAVNLCLEQSTRLMKLATESKDYTDYLKGQAEVVKDITERMMAETKTNMQVVGEVRDDYRNWYEQSLSGMSSDLREAASQAA